MWKRKFEFYGNIEDSRRVQGSRELVEGDLEAMKSRADESMLEARNT